MTHTAFFGFVSIAMMALSRAIYLASIFKGKTKPHAFSWLIWATISGIGFAAQVAEGAGPGSWARGFSAATCCILAVLGYYKGEKDITKGDWTSLVVAFCAIPLWIITKTPVWSVLIVCIIDTIGYFPTIRKAWNKPYEESASSYFIATLCSFFSLFAIEHYTISTWLYPALLVFSNSALGIFLLVRRGSLSHQQV
ncbi:MAG TPA: hypothetical protein DCL44_11225 [Elusimicrobia bacterium]|nr:hypothetical protein [Elusimicrobiota bacterium]